jgi:hypothetical protein
MNEQILDEITAEVLRRMQQPTGSATALLIGKPPKDPTGYQYTDHPPYDAVVIGSLEASELLSFSEPRVIDALLSGIPVYLNEDGLAYRRYRSTANRLLYARLTEREKELRQLGILPLPGTTSCRSVITAGMARELRRRNQRPAPGAVITPLAREILEGLAP